MMTMKRKDDRYTSIKKKKGGGGIGTKSDPQKEVILLIHAITKNAISILFLHL